MKYFAYGSNMCTRRLTKRVSSAVFEKVGAIEHFALKFHKRSIDGSAKCDAFYTKNPDDKVYGVVFDIDESEKENLDGFEGRGNGYNQITVRVRTNEEIIEIFTYVADETAIDDSLEPYTWYKDLVINGAQEHLLPEYYINEIRTVGTKSDPDKEREQNEREAIPCA